MKYIVLICAAVIVSVAAASFTFGHNDRSEVTRLQSELKRLSAHNEKLKQKNNSLHDRVIALRDDPRLAERRARESGKLARANELIFQFTTPEKQAAVEVTLKLKPEGMILAGRPVELKVLGKQLESLKQRFAIVNLTIEDKHEMDALQKQRIMDLVKGANLASTTIKKK